MATHANANRQDDPNNPLAPRSHNTAPTTRHGHDPDLLIHATSTVPMAFGPSNMNTSIEPSSKRKSAKKYSSRRIA